MKKRIREAVQNLLAKRVKGDEGVTLIELLAVIVILAVIAVIAVPIVVNNIDNAKINTTKQSEAVIAEALNRYAANNNGAFPTATTPSALETALKDASTGGPYIQSIPKDGFGGDFTIVCDGTSYTITSSKDTISVTSK